MKKLIIILMFAVTLFPLHAFAAGAKATIKGTTDNSELYGSATFKETPEGLSVDAEVFGAPPGLHGAHIHENGSCADKGNGAGGHYNPDGVPHGLVAKDGFTKAHAGDFGNMEVGADGHGILSMVVPGLTASSGAHSVDGRAIIIHGQPDDFSQPTGNAGARIACGVISTDQ